MGSPVYRVKEKHVDSCEKEWALLYSCLSKYIRIKDLEKKEWDTTIIDEFEYEDCLYPVMDFGLAIQMLKDGKRCYREGWNGKGMYIELQVPDEHSKMSLPYIYMRTVQGDLVPWLASQTDVLSEDWAVYND